LIRNAIRFTPEGSRVVIRVSESTDRCTVSVRDFGPGIPEEIRGTLFEPLVQAPSEQQRGIGLGLTIAQSIAELHGGRIAVANIPDGGCEFTVTLPCDPSEAPGRPAPNNGECRTAGPASPTDAAAATRPAPNVEPLTATSIPRETGAPRSG
jgi:Histidine kinase-, DNA gyrase B-, and HSP90-like ATPase